MKSILALGAGAIGTALAKHPRIQVVSRKQFARHMLSNVDALVNCTGIAGTPNCKAAGYEAAKQANIDKPMELNALCKREGIAFIQLSSTAVYKQRTCVDIAAAEFARIDAPVYPHNLYCATKLLMEQQLTDVATVIRLPWFRDAPYLRQRAKDWTYVQDTWTSYLDAETLQNVIWLCAERETPPGLYQVSSGVLYFPDYINKLLNRQMPLRQTYSYDMSSAIPIQPNL